VFEEVKMSTIGILVIWAIGVFTGGIFVMYAHELSQWAEVILGAASLALALMIAFVSYRGEVNWPRHS
jgi:hypothetical protein